MGLADRFVDCNLEKNVFARKMDFLAQSLSVNPFLLEKTNNVQKPKFDQLKNELFEKIVTIPCWFEYDAKTQYDLIIKFLNSKDINTPEVFAKVLQHSVLGFGVFDEYLLKDGVTALYYDEGEPIIYTQNDRNVVETTILSSAKVRLAVQNIINMSQSCDKKGVYDFRIGDYWVQMRAIPHTQTKISITKITDEFISNEIDKSNLTLLLSDI